MPRLGVLAIGLLAVLSAACGSGAPSSSQPPATSARTFADYHAASDPSENDLVMHADLEGSEGIRFMAADTPIKMEYRPGTNFSMSLSGDDEAQLRGYFEKLAEGGSVTMPLEKAAWGDIFGMCTDRFGISWLVNVTATAN